MSLSLAKAAVINCSHPHYNLGAAKLANWLRCEGWDAVQFDGRPGPLMLGGFDLVCLSVIFSWDAPAAASLAAQMRDRAEVWAGGPGLFGDRKNNYRMRNWFKQISGIDAHVGLDWRFERQRGNYRMTFASRGCPEDCHFCNVTRIEGKEFRFDEEFQLAPILCDNNLSQLPEEYQNEIVVRYFCARSPLLDANSGFEPKAFTWETYFRWKPILRGPWRFGFDMQPEWRRVWRVTQILKNEPARKKRLYVLIGNEPMESCYERAIKTLEWGCEPHCQYMLPLDWLHNPHTGEIPAHHDWTSQKLKDFARYFNTWGWRTYPLSEYEPRIGERPFRNTRFRYVLNSGKIRAA